MSDAQAASYSRSDVESRKQMTPEIAAIGARIHVISNRMIARREKAPIQLPKKIMIARLIVAAVNSTYDAERNLPFFKYLMFFL